MTSKSININQEDFSAFDDMKFEDLFSNNIELPDQNNTINTSHAFDNTKVDPFVISKPSRSVDTSKQTNNHIPESASDDNDDHTIHISTPRALTIDNSFLLSSDDNNELTMHAFDFFGTNGDLQPVEESQLGEYFNQLAQQMNDSTDSTPLDRTHEAMQYLDHIDETMNSEHAGISHNMHHDDDDDEEIHQQSDDYQDSDDDCEWLEHDRANLDNIKSQHDEKNKIQVKKSTIIISLKQSTPTNNSMNSTAHAAQAQTANISNMTDNSSQMRELTLKQSGVAPICLNTKNASTMQPKLLQLPPELSGLINISQNSTQPLQQADYLRLLNKNSQNIFTKIHKDEMKDHFDDFNDHHFEANFDDIAMENDDAIISILPSQQLPILTPSITSFHTDSFETTFDDDEKALELQKQRIQQQKARLASKIQKDSSILQHQQDLFLEKISQYQDQLRVNLSNNPLFALCVIDTMNNGVQSGVHHIIPHDGDDNENCKIVVNHHNNDNDDDGDLGL